MKATHRFLSICFLTLLLSACDNGDDGNQPATGTISGTVIAAKDQSPVADAEVTIVGLKTNSAADGSFELSNVPTGSAVIRAEASGFAPYEENVQVRVDRTITTLS